MNKEQAKSIALKLVTNQNINTSGKTLKVISNKLYIFPKGLVQGIIPTKHLVYRIEVRNDADVREFLFIDAKNGKLIEQFTGIAHVLHRVLYEVNTNFKRWEEGDSFPGPLNFWQRNEVAAPLVR